jgi:hypothetical protein
MRQPSSRLCRATNLARGLRGTQQAEEGGASKKPRVVWSVDMHQQFVLAVNQLGVDSES